MVLPNKVYDTLKWFVLVFTDALIGLITTLGIIYKFDSAIIVGTIAAVSTFVGALIGISSNVYKKVQKPDVLKVDETNGMGE